MAALRRFAGAPSRVRVFDIGLVTALSGVNVATGVAAGDELWWMPVLALLPVPLLWRRRRPLVSAAATGVLAALTASGYTAGPHPMPLFAVVVIALFSVAYHETDLRRAALGGVLIALGGSADILIHGPGGIGDAFWMWRVPEFVIVWLVGRAFYSRRRQVDELEDRADALTRTHDARMTAAVAEERARLARELHDVVAHSVSVMVVQAGAAERVLDTNPAAVAGSLQNIQHVGRQTVVELRRLLGILKQGDPEALTSPQPSLVALDDLVEQTTAAGLPVRLTVHGERAAVPASVDLSGYRIVQEGLTNALKHADATCAEVRVVYREDSVEVTVADNGKGAHDTGTWRGNGLIGVSERTAMFGGTFEASSRPEGGFALRAVLPFGSGVR